MGFEKGPDAEVDSRYPFLSGGGGAAVLIAGFDWSRTPLGPLAEWPQNLTAATALLLRSPMPILLLWGRDGVMIYNDAYSAFAGGRHPTLFGSKVREGWPEIADFNDNVMKVGLAGGKLAYRDRELTLLRHRGEPEQVWMNLDCSPVLDADGRPAGVIAMVSETTARVKAEERLKAEREQACALVEAEEQLRQAQKMDAIGRLTGGVAHDLNNLLQIISGNLQLLGKDVAGNGRAEQRVANAVAGVNRGSKLANQLLAFGRRQALEPKVIDIGRFVLTLEALLHRTIGEAIEIETIRSGGLWNAFVDPSQIENAILNLAINAHDAMNGTGKLTIEIGNAHIDDADARQHPDIRAGQYVLIAVTDTGEGMEADVLGRAFEPFFSTKPAGKGSGLGLSMVYGFVKQSGGHVKIHSAPGEGTTVHLYLPRSLEEEDRLAEADFGPLTGGAETILVAEDDDEVRATVVEMLGDLGYSVLKARDAASALSVIESGVTIDLLFTDVVMPGPLRSTDLARRAREHLPNLAVLFTSGYAENSIVHEGRLDAGIALLSKPYSQEALARKIRASLAGRQPLPPAGITANGDGTGGEETRRLTILLVEDDFLIRLNAVDLVQELGHEVVEATTAEQALPLLKERRFDVLLTDIGLPAMSGADLAVHARTQDTDIGVVFATGHDRLPTVPGDRAPVLLMKPYDSREIAVALAAAIA